MAAMGANVNELGANISEKLKSLLNGGGVENGKPKCLGAVPDDSELFAYARRNNIPDWVCTDWKYWQLEPKRVPLKNWIGSLKWFAKLKMASEAPDLRAHGNASEAPDLRAHGNASGPQTQADAKSDNQRKYLELLGYLGNLEPGKSPEATLQKVRAKCPGLSLKLLLAWCRGNARYSLEKGVELERLINDWAKSRGTTNAPLK